jgi:hypothetical protein
MSFTIKLLFFFFWKGKGLASVTLSLIDRAQPCLMLLGSSSPALTHLLLQSIKYSATEIILESFIVRLFPEFNRWHMNNLKNMFRQRHLLYEKEQQSIRNHERKSNDSKVETKQKARPSSRGLIYNTMFFRIVNFELFMKENPNMIYLGYAGTGIFIALVFYFTNLEYRDRKEKHRIPSPSYKGDN